jgi:hypothetical protein
LDDSIADVPVDCFVEEDEEAAPFLDRADATRFPDLWSSIIMTGFVKTEAITAPVESLAVNWMLIEEDMMGTQMNQGSACGLLRVFLAAFS